MRALALRLGTSATALYRLFPSKAALLTKARRRATDGLRQNLRAALDGQPVHAAVLGWVEVYISADARDPWIDSLLPGSGPDSASGDEAAEAVGLKALRTHVEEAHARGYLRAGLSPSLACWLLWSQTHAVLRLRGGVLSDTPGLTDAGTLRPAEAIVNSLLRLDAPSSAAEPRRIRAGGVI